MKTIFLVFGLMAHVGIYAQLPAPGSVQGILAEDPLRVIVSSLPTDKAAVLHASATDWFRGTSSVLELDTKRANMLKLLYSDGSAAALAFADTFVSGNPSSPPRPHPATPEELVYATVFCLPKTADWRPIGDISMHDMTDTLPSSAATRATKLRKLLGLTEIPVMDVYRSIPHDRETVIPWVIALLREAKFNEQAVGRLHAQLALLIAPETSGRNHDAEVSDQTTSPPTRVQSSPASPALKTQNIAAPSCSTRRSVIVVAIAAAACLLWMLLKKRTE